MFIYFTDHLSSPPGPLIDNKTGCPWEVPTKGLLSIHFQSANMPPSSDQIATDEAIKILTSASEPHHQKNLSDKNSERRVSTFVLIDSLID